jgi:hypothetical protein
LFAIRKVGQWKTLSSQRKIWFGFQENVFPFSCVCFPEVVSEKPLSKLLCVCLPLEKLVNGKHFPEVVKNLEMSLFADYIKFDPQTFDCYI